MNEMLSPWDLALAQLPIIRKSDQPPKFNPRPAGKIIPGSATDQVLQTLMAAPGFMTRGQICLRVCRPRGAVNWALTFLKQQGLIQAVRDAKRNPAYYRYKFIQPEVTRHEP